MMPVSFRISKQELRLLQDVIVLDEEVQDSIDNAVQRGNGYEIAFSHEVLDALMGSLAFAANHEESARKQDKLDKLCDKVDRFLNLYKKLIKLSDLGESAKVSQLSDGDSEQLPMIKMRSSKAKSGDRVFVFRITLDDRRDLNNCVREIGILGRQNLYNFAEGIVKSFDFYFDHCFGFYDNLKSHTHSKVGYELFPDIGEEASRGCKGVKKTKVSEAFRSIGDKMLFFFDYGDCWHFIVELGDIWEAVIGTSFPVLLKSAGDPPLQYPPLDEENCEWQQSGGWYET